MYRATSHILNYRTVLYSRPYVEVQKKKISRSSPEQKYASLKERDTCPPPPPPIPPPPKDDRLLWGALSALVVTGSFMYYAKNNPEVRDWLTLYAPWFDDMIAVVYQENMTYKQIGEQCVEDAKRYIAGYSGDSKPRQCSLKGGGVAIGGASKKSSSEQEAPKCDENAETEKCESIPPPPVVKKTICEIDEDLKDIGESIINNYFTAKEACHYYNKLVEERMINFDPSAFKNLHEAMAERRDLVKASTCNITAANEQLALGIVSNRLSLPLLRRRILSMLFISVVPLYYTLVRRLIIPAEDLIRYLDCGVQAPKEVIDATKGLFNDFQDRIGVERIQFQWANDKSIELDKQVVKVEELINKYTDENRSLFTGLKYDDKKLQLQGDPDMLLYQTQRYVAKLQNELSEASDAMSERVNRAFFELNLDEAKRKARCACVRSEITKRRAAIDQEYRQRYDDQAASNDMILKHALKSQLETLDANLKAKLEQKEKELEVKIEKMMAETLAAEKKKFRGILDKMAKELKKVEDKLNARLKAEREARRSQDLWRAGEALLAATKKGDPIVKVDSELNAIQKASGDDDKLVQVVLKSIPDTLRSEGLVPESVLRERYHKMEKTALAVALVEADGGPLPVYLLSWIQSRLLFMRLSCIPQSEIDKPPDKPSKDLDTFDLLRRARYYMQHGDVSRALSYVSALQGASALAARPWREAARAHVAARLAADALRAHAAALGLRNL